MLHSTIIIMNKNFATVRNAGGVGRYVITNQNVVMEPGLCKDEGTTVSDFPLLSLSLTVSISFSLATSRLGSRIALGPSWVSLALFSALFLLFVGWPHRLQWHLVCLVWPGGQKILWAMII